MFMKVDQMPMKKVPIGKDSDGKPVNVVWGDDLNWAHGFVEGPQHQQKEYYRAQGRGDAHYVVARDMGEKLDASKNPIYRYWYITMHIDGETTHLPTEFMVALEGMEVCQIWESERDTRAHTQSLERTRARIEHKIKDYKTGGEAE